MLLGSAAPPRAAALARAAPQLPAELRPLARRRPRGSAPRSTGGSVYTDDKAPVEWLIDKSIVDYAAAR